MTGDTAGEAAIYARGLTKYFDSLLAVDHISFSIEQGELFGFLGPNGAGKTTTIRIFMNLTRSSEGTATVYGMDTVRDTLALKSVVGIVPEVSNVFPEITARSNLTFTGALYGMGRRESASRAVELLGMFGLEEHGGKKAGQLSLGLKRRLAIAMSMVHRPKVLFLDEPTSGLDVTASRSIREIVKRLNSEGVTFFLTTHNMEEANQLCDRIAVINRGKIIAVDTPGKLRRAASEAQSVEVTLNRRPTAVEEAGLAGIDGVTGVAEAGESYRLLTADPERTLRSLFRFLEAGDLAVSAVSTPGPTLEDVFVKLTSEEQDVGSGS
ncbi:MAG: ATP-binding cassette domain-containing protein [Actinobacteria bacterium]|nr:ATP-binding cassette domain-containing protein [Actinomycetota bacterium]MBU1944889.1 ATP-binding cassette domain-containing protein [Actinomycetota bacterium]MBU2688093.1 ATP-binding cassette domain-containing protein [Actinomycetota bacterium]